MEIIYKYSETKFPEHFRKIFLNLLCTLVVVVDGVFVDVVGGKVLVLLFAVGPWTIGQGYNVRVQVVQEKDVLQGDRGALLLPIGVDVLKRIIKGTENIKKDEDKDNLLTLSYWLIKIHGELCFQILAKMNNFYSIFL